MFTKKSVAVVNTKTVVPNMKTTGKVKEIGTRGNLDKVSYLCDVKILL